MQTFKEGSAVLADFVCTAYLVYGLYYVLLFGHKWHEPGPVKKSFVQCNYVEFLS